MKLALAISGQRQSKDAVNLARVAEDLGLAQVWLTEDYCERGAFALAGAIAATTREIKIGIGVVNPWTRHPVLTAMEAAAVAELAPQRLLLGLGASNPRWMQQQLGIPFHHPLGVLDEAVTVVRAMLSGEDADLSDLRHFEVSTSLAFPPPGDVPIILGVKGPKALQLAARASDGVLLSVLSSAPYVRWARQRLGQVPTGAYVACRVDDDRHAARAAMKPFVARFLGIHGSHAITRTAGLDQELARKFRRGLQDGSPREDLVTDELVDTFVVAGDREHAAARVAELADAGLDTFVVHDQNDPSPQHLLATMKQIVENTD